MGTREELPRVLEVQRFAAARQEEIKALSAALKSPDSQLKWGHSALPRHLRRRATSHNSYVHRRRPNIKLHAKRQKSAVSSGEEAECSTPVCVEIEAEAPRYENRAMRRRKGRLQQKFLQAASNFIPGANLEAPRRLETHVWHAKRMKMTTRWGHVLAEGACGKGFGSKAFLAALRSGVVTHDASYWVAFQLTASQADLFKVMSSVSDQASIFSQRPEMARGVLEHDIILHSPGSCPSGALTPAKVLFWSAPSLAVTAQPVTVSEASAAAALSEAIIWVHPAASAESHAALLSACEGTSASLSCRADLRRLEVRGAKSDRAVSAALNLLSQEKGQQQPPDLPGSVQTTSRNIWQLMQATHGATASQLPHNMALPLHLKDARLARTIRAAVSLSTLEEVSTRAPASGPTQPPCYSEEIRAAKMLARRMMTAAESPASVLMWSAGSVPLPMPEQAVCQIRRRAKLAALHLPADDLAPTPAAPSPERAIDGCPALAVRRAAADNRAAPGWSLILPAGWASQFWQALVYNGARPAGQRDWRWAAAHQGVGFFPHDFPDTAAYARLAAELHAEQERLRQLRPKGRFPPGTPHPPDWAAVFGSGPPETPTTSAAPSEPKQDAVTAVSQPMKEFAALEPMEEDGVSQQMEQDLQERTGKEEHPALSGSAPKEQNAQERTNEEEQPTLQGDQNVQPSGLHDMVIDSSTPVTADALPADAFNAGIPTAMEVEPSACGKEEGSPEAIRPANKNAAAAAASAADDIPQSFARAETWSAPHFYVARTLPQLDAAMARQASLASEPDKADADRDARVQEGSVGPAEMPAGGQRGWVRCRPAGHLAEADALCLLRVSVHVIGRGVAEEGAALCAMAPSEAADIRRAILRKKTLKRMDEGQGQLIAATQSGLQENVREVLSSRGARDVGAHEQIIGYVTSAAPRGLAPWRGATAVCTAGYFLRIRTEQKGADAGGGIIVEMRCPASTVMRVAEARLILDGSNVVGQI